MALRPTYAMMKTLPLQRPTASRAATAKERNRRDKPACCAVRAFSLNEICFSLKFVRSAPCGSNNLRATRRAAGFSCAWWTVEYDLPKLLNRFCRGARASCDACPS
jgi:hypothetical protein